MASVAGLENLLHYVIDDVPAGSYKYYSLMYDGLVKIRLSTQLVYKIIVVFCTNEISVNTLSIQ